MYDRRTGQPQRKRVFVCLLWRAITSNLWPVSFHLWHWTSGSYREAGVGWSLAWQTADERWSPAEFMTPNENGWPSSHAPAPTFTTAAVGLVVFVTAGSQQRETKFKVLGGHVALCDGPFDIHLLYIWGEDFHMKYYSKVINWLYNADSTAARSPGFLWKCGKIWDKPLSDCSWV